MYERLREIGVTKVQGFNVPQLIRHDALLRVIEMSVAVRPFVLDFAGAYLDVPPDFPEEIWREWESAKAGQLGERWPTVRAVLAALEDWDIHMVDVSSSNIALLDP